MDTAHLRLLAVVVSCVGIVVTLYRARKPGLSRPWLIYRGIVLLYFAVIYAMALLGYRSEVLLNGTLTLSGVVMLLLAFIADSIAEPRCDD